MSRRTVQPVGSSGTNYDILSTDSNYYNGVTDIDISGLYIPSVLIKYLQVTNNLSVTPLITYELIDYLRSYECYNIDYTYTDSGSVRTYYSRSPRPVSPDLNAYSQLSGVVVSINKVDPSDPSTFVYTYITDQQRTDFIISHILGFIISETSSEADINMAKKFMGIYASDITSTYYGYSIMMMNKVIEIQSYWSLPRTGMIDPSTYKYIASYKS